ncbi:hypothetical protein [Enterobacter roggenkampii]|uniref:gp53-like domain-containing protein n=1 Tax=Enterobacter roggenkampii TaxID=1812935 RepID=UPI002FD80744
MALTLLAANNAQTVLAAGISASATSMTVNTGTGALFPAPVSGTSFFKLTLIDAATGQITEIVHVTARSGDTMTIDRAQEGTTARAWSANDIAANMMTAGTLGYILNNFQPLDATLTSLAALPTGVNKLPYFIGTDNASQTDLTSVGRDIIGKGTVADILTYLGLSDILHKGDYGVGGSLQGSAGSGSHVGGFMYEPYQANNLYPVSVALMQAGGPTPTEWAQIAVAYGGAFRAFLGRQVFGGSSEISELYHDRRKPTAADVGAQPLDATLTTLSGKDASGLRSVLGLGTTATRNVGTGSSQIPDMSSFLSGSTSSAFWYKLPGGMVMMGGNASGISSGSAGNGVFFPIPFPNACSSVVVTLVSNGLYANTVSFNTYIPGTNRFNVYTNTSGTYAIYYLAFGS